MPKLKELSPRLRVGKGIERSNLTIFPLFGEGPIEAAEYVPIGAAIGLGYARITEISEGGSVPTLALDNFGTIPVLILDGEQLIGARQNRIANLTILAPAKQVMKIPVSCVERGRWGYATQANRASHEFTESPNVMFHEVRAQKSRDVSQAMMCMGSHVADQSSVWSHISSMAAKLGHISRTDAMEDVYEKSRASMDEYLRDIEVADGQIGAVFAINGKPAGLELFDSTETLKTYLPKIVRSYSLNAMTDQSGTTKRNGQSQAEAQKLLDSVLELDAKSFPALGLGEDFRIESPEITGGALAQNGRVIHLAAFTSPA
jgi:hypothetical protein